MIDEDLRKVISIVCLEYGIDKRLLFKKTRKSAVVEARSVITHIMKSNGMRYSEISNRLNLDRSTLYYYVDKIKNLISVKDDKVIEVIEKIDKKVGINKNPSKKLKEKYSANDIKEILQPMFEDAIERITKILENRKQ